jgi:isoleucyl-tRNA synthetase
MSKSKGNMVDPWAVVNEYGADALRWYMLSSAPGEHTHRFSAEMVGETLRKNLLTLWNTYSFFVLYANIDRFSPQASAFPSFAELDNWIISELNQLIVDVTRSMDGYNPTSAIRHIETFVDGLSNWYVRRSRRRFWKSENDADKLAAHTTLYRCLVTLSQLLAPLVPFIAEEIYQNLVRSVDPMAVESVHLTDFPVADGSRINDELNSDMKLAMRISSLGRAARAKAKIKVRQPLAKVLVRVSQEDEKSALQRLAPHVLEEINVRELEFAGYEFPGDMPGYAVANEERYSVAVNIELSPELVAEGMSREIVRRLQTMRRAAGFDIADHIVTYYEAAGPIERVMTDFSGYIKQETLSIDLVNSSPPRDAYAEKYHISHADVVLAVAKAPF